MVCVAAPAFDWLTRDNQRLLSRCQSRFHYLVANIDGDPVTDMAFETVVFLLDNDIPLVDLGQIEKKWWQSGLNIDDSVVFERTEGVYTIAVDAGADGGIDAFVRDVESGTVTTITVSGTNATTTITIIFSLSEGTFTDPTVNVGLNNSEELEGVGAVYIISGVDGSEIRRHVATSDGTYFGVSVNGDADFDGDGTRDYIIGAPGPLVQPNPTDSSVEIRSGLSGALLAQVNYGPSYFQLGASSVLAELPNGNPAAVIGAPSINNDVGGVAVLRRPVEGDLILYPPGNLLRQTFGTSIQSIGDFDGRGGLHVVIGAPNIPFGSAFGGGDAFIYDITTGEIKYQVSGGSFDGAIGYAFTGVGDRNGDGNPELVVGAPGSIGDGLYGAGRVYFLTVTDP